VSRAGNAGVLAELEFFHSRRIAPTRRVALGDSELPCDPAPGFGGLLLGGVVAANWRALDEDDVGDLTRLSLQLEEGHRIAQPRLRFRFQKDRIGLLRSRARLVRSGGQLAFEFDDERSLPAQRLLAAIYAAGALPLPARRSVFAAIRRGLRWEGPIGPSLIASLSGVGLGHPLTAMAMDDPVGWALEMLGFVPGRDDPIDGLAVPRRGDVQRRFRVLLRAAHPDHGGDTVEAAQRIADLREARRILLTPA
jgi:hypothetical protein